MPEHLHSSDVLLLCTRVAAAGIVVPGRTVYLARKVPNP